VIQEDGNELLIAVNNPQKGDVLFRGTAAVDDLSPESKSIADLNRSFREEFIEDEQNGISTVNFGEAEKTCVKLGLCFRVVEPDSANPGYSGNHHSFMSVNSNHRSICKPFNKRDPRYSVLRDFIQSTIHHTHSLKQQPQPKHGHGHGHGQAT